MQTTVSATINRDIQEVWDFVSDVRNRRHWVAGTREVQPSFQGPPSIGETFSADYLHSGVIHHISGMFTRIAAPETLEIRSVSSPFPFADSLHLEPFGEEGTRLIHTVEVGPDGFMTRLSFILLRPIVSSMVKSQMRKDLRRLRQLLETDEVVEDPGVPSAAGSERRDRQTEVARK